MAQEETYAEVSDLRKRSRHLLKILKNLGKEEVCMDYTFYLKNTVNSLHNGPCSDLELVPSLARTSNRGEVVSVKRL